MGWIKSRISERTSWDGGVLIAMGLIALFATNFIKIAAVAAILWGLWTIWKGEEHVGNDRTYGYRQALDIHCYSR